MKGFGKTGAHSSACQKPRPLHPQRRRLDPAAVWRGGHRARTAFRKHEGAPRLFCGLCRLLALLSAQTVELARESRSKIAVGNPWASAATRAASSGWSRRRRLYCRDLAKIITAAKRMTPAIAKILKTCSSVTALSIMRHANFEGPTFSPRSAINCIWLS